MNKKIELKFMRSIINYHFGPQKVKLLDNMWYKDYEVEPDDDCIGIYKICNIIKNFNKQLDEKEIINIYNLLIPSKSKKEINTYSLNNAINYVNNNTDIKSILNYFRINPIFEDYSFDMSVIIYNIFYFKKYKNFFVLHHIFKNDIYDSLKNNSQEKYTEVMNKIIEKNQSYNIKRPIKNIDYFKEKVLEIPKNHLDFFNIDHIYIFGSYAKKRNDNYSDVDLHIISHLNCFLIQQGIILSDYFSKLFKIKVDVNVTTSIISESNKALFDKEIKIL